MEENRITDVERVPCENSELFNEAHDEDLMSHLSVLRETP
jgi:hypothetical protein